MGGGVGNAPTRPNAWSWCLGLSTVDILGWVILCRGELSCSLRTTQQYLKMNNTHD